MDYIFGGAITFENALKLIVFLIALGNLTTAKMNRLKCHGPARIIAILGMLFDSKNRILLACKNQWKKRQ